ncbi:uncharacterized protein LOC119079605 isoform X2 [Bradysia coprophila]|uniref:uncharacterized protein LOC119079605 isoform X2 n=1 Tax=Bradysia coprophila TaxID=38358 RepID=UPI00187DBA27|nr:uncharacterized protein LOC119079605 isoform X2 [Bradysia coprophila]
MLNRIWFSCLISLVVADLRVPKSSGVIVNPFYDPKDDANDIKKTDPNEILPPTHQQLAETLNLRNIINTAVRNNAYFVGGDSPMTSPKPFQWFANLLGTKSGKNVGSSNIDKTEELGMGTVADATDVSGTANVSNKEAGAIQSNVIDSVIMSRLESKPFTISQKKVQREQLELISVEEDLNFAYGENVRSWITIESRTNNVNGLIGISNSSLVLIRVDQSGTYELVEELDLKIGIRCFTNYEHWNQTSKSVHSIVIVEMEGQLLFVSTRNDLSGWDVVWQWTIHTKLDSLIHFKHESSHMLLMVNSPFGQNSGVSADMYKFDLQSRNTWLVQKIPLNHPCKSVAIINTYRDLILCFAQSNTVDLFKSDQHADSQSFEYFSSIEANSVQRISGFQMGGFSYLATTGLEPKIFRYHRGSFVAQTILSRSWGLVEAFFPIPARTYRDDLILLVQHRIMMGTHTVAVVEALIWNGESFDVSLSVPCRIGNEILDFGMTCLLDYDRDSGIDGLSIIQDGNSISLIVPRVEAPSSMFRLTFQLKSFDSPSSTVTKDFQIFSKSIEATTNYQNDIMSMGADALSHGLNADRNDVSAMWNLSMVTAGSLSVNDGATWKIAENFFFGNEKWTKDMSNVNIVDLSKIVHELQSDVDRLQNEFTETNTVEHTSDSPIHVVQVAPNGKFDINTARVIKGERRVKRTEGSNDGRIYFDELNVKHVQVDYINDIPVNDIIFIHDGILNAVDSLIVEGNLDVLNEVEIAPDDMDRVGESLEDQRSLDKLIPADNVQLTGDLIVDSINGVIWQDFLHQIVMKNLPNFMPLLVVNGDVLAMEPIEVGYLNQISFLEEFLWMRGLDISSVTGQKIFKGTITADSVDTSGPVDGVYTQETITLGETQHIRGLTTFTQLEVTENLDVNGTINGKHLDEFKPNLSLQESNIILSDCLFQNLQVQGPIIISNYCNGVILDDIFADVVYKSSPKATISSFKTFESVESVVELTSNLMNNIPVDNYMTADTVQDIHFDKLVGNVMFRELYTNGLFGFINVTELDRNSIKLTGEQYTEAELIFDGADEINFVAEVVEIQSSFNGLSTNDMIVVDESLVIDGNFIVNSAIINDAVIDGDVNGNGVINGLSLAEFDAVRLSRSRAQDITSSYFIENVLIEGDIVAEYVNGVNIMDLTKHISHVTNLLEFLSSTDVKVTNLIVDGNVSVQTINGHDFNSIKDNAIWLNRPNIVVGELQFLDAFEISQGIIVNNVNNEIFQNFIDGLVVKTDENIEFVGRKVFQNEFHVDQDIQIATVNGIPIERIWTKSPTASFTGSVNIFGDLFVEHMNLQGYANSVNWRNIEYNYQFDAERGSHILKNNVRFTAPTNINHLHIQHGLNAVENITDFLALVIRKNHAGPVTGTKLFQNSVIFMNHLQAAAFDTVDIPLLFENLVINDVNERAVIFGDVAFDNDVTASHIQASGSILSHTLMECKIAEWKENALSTNEPVKVFQQLIFPAETLRTNNVEVQFVNGNPMATIFTLNSDQTFENSVQSDTVSLSKINVDGLVNGYDMKTLRDNSVLVTGDNYITAPTTLQTARVLSVLQTVDTINGKNLNNIATLHEDLRIYGPLSFRSITARNLNTKDTISGIDFDYWYANALWKSQRENQIVRGKWTVTEGIIRGPVTGAGILNGIRIDQLAGQIGAYQSNVLNNFEIFRQGYIENCHKMENLIHQTRTLPYFLTYFEESFSLRVHSVLNSVHFFVANDQSYAVINLACLTVLYAWNRNTENYEKIFETETGNVDAWLDMTDETNLLHLISNTETDYSNCPTSGLNIWKFDGTSLLHVSKIADSSKFALLHSSKLHPQRFLAMTKDAGVVNEFDLQSNLVEQWHLPVGDQPFRFLPENANLGIALSDGKQLSSLSYATATDHRKQRSTRPLNDAVELKRFVRCPFLDETVENATAKCKLWHQATLKALVNIGPYKQVDVATQNRLLSDVNMTNTLLGKSPFKLKAIPPENGQLQYPKFVQSFTKNGQSSTGYLQQMLMTQKSQPRNENENSTADSGPLQNPKIVQSSAESVKSSNSNADQLLAIKMNRPGNENEPFQNGKVVQMSTQNQESANSDRPPLLPAANSNSVNDNKPLNSSARDAFGDIEKVTIEIADQLIDSLIDVETAAEDIDFDDSLVGL